MPAHDLGLAAGARPEARRLLRVKGGWVATFAAVFPDGSQPTTWVAVGLTDAGAVSWRLTGKAAVNDGSGESLGALPDGGALLAVAVPGESLVQRWHGSPWPVSNPIRSRPCSEVATWTCSTSPPWKPRLITACC